MTSIFPLAEERLYLKVELRDLKETLTAGCEALVRLGDTVLPQGFSNHFFQHLQQNIRHDLYFVEKVQTLLQL